MTSRLVYRAMLGFYIFLFFAFLFGPLLVMGATAFNTPTYPQVYPFEGFTLRWFEALLADRTLLEGFRNSLLIGSFVVCLAVRLGVVAFGYVKQRRRERETP